MTARDVRYGRRGGGWIDGPQRTAWPLCDLCDRPLTVGQHGRHLVCAGLVPAAGTTALPAPPRLDDGLPDDPEFDLDHEGRPA